MMTALSTDGGPLPLDSLPDVLPLGSMAGPWRVERELGRGGMGAVYAVVHEEIGKRAALKVVHRSLLTPSFNVERVLLEAKVVNAVGHPNIVDIFETGTLPDGRPYIVMERLEGQPLSVRARTQKMFLEQLPFEAETSAEIMVMHLKAVPPAPRDLWPDIPTELEELLLRMLAKQPTNRPTMTEVARHLDEVRAELDRRRGISQALDVVTLVPRQTIIRPPSVGLAPTVASDSIRWPADGRARRWQWTVGVTALIAVVLMFAISRTGDTGIADATPEPSTPVLAAEPMTNPPQQGPVQTFSTPGPGAPSPTLVTPPPSVPANVRANVRANASANPGTPRGSRDRRSPARKLIPPHRSGGPIAPNGTIDAYR